jgi:hypothetical protein
MMLLNGICLQGLWIYKQLNKQLNTPHTSAYFLSDDSPVSNLIGILNLLLGEITLCGTDAAAIRVPLILLIWILWRCTSSIVTLTGCPW